MSETIDRAEAILAVLKSEGPMTTQEIATRVGVGSAGHVSTYLVRLHREGGVDRTPPHAASRILWWLKGQS